MDISGSHDSASIVLARNGGGLQAVCSSAPPKLRHTNTSTLLDNNASIEVPYAKIFPKSLLARCGGCLLTSFHTSNLEPRSLLHTSTHQPFATATRLQIDVSHTNILPQNLHKVDTIRCDQQLRKREPREITPSWLQDHPAERGARQSLLQCLRDPSTNLEICQLKFDE